MSRDPSTCCVLDVLDLLDEAAVPPELLARARDQEDDLDDVPALMVQHKPYQDAQLFRWLWNAMLGVQPTRLDVKAFAQRGIAPTAENVLKFLFEYLGVGISSTPESIRTLNDQTAAYASRMSDPAFCRQQMLSKLWERYVSPQPPPVEDELWRMPLQEAYAEILLKRSQSATLLFNSQCYSVDEFFQLSTYMLDKHKLLYSNVLSGARNPRNAPLWRRYKGRLSVEEGARFCIMQDRQLLQQLAGAVVAYSDGTDAGSLTEWATASNAMSPKPLVVLSTDPKPTWHHALPFNVVMLHVPLKKFPFVLRCMPRIAARFVWHFAPPRKATSPGGLLVVPPGLAMSPIHNVVLLPGQTITTTIAKKHVPWDALRIDAYDRVLVGDPGVWPMAERFLAGPDAPTPYLLLPGKHEGIAEVKKGIASALSCSVPLNAHAWKLHMAHRCPLKRRPGDGAAASPADHQLLFLQFLLRYLTQNAHAVDTAAAAPPAAPTADGRTLLVIDNRPSILSVISTYVSLSNLNRGSWGLTIGASEDSKAFFQKWFPEDWDIAWLPLELGFVPSKFSIQTYSDLLKSAAFWQRIPQATCLLIQDDGMIAKPGLEDDPRRFVQYDYIGAPWLPHPSNEPLRELANPELVGNGGLSLRSTRAMEALTKEHAAEAHDLFGLHPMEVPEDVYLCHLVHASPRHKLCPTESACGFAMEQRYSPTAYGFHKFWMYHQAPVVAQYFEAALRRA